MRIISNCQKCGKSPAEWHHRFSNTKLNIKKYGKHLIHHPKNGKMLCAGCHKNKLTKFDKLTEREFIDIMDLWGYCQKKAICQIETFPFGISKDEEIEVCAKCRDYKFDKEFYYEETEIKENHLIPGSYGYKE